MITICSNRSKDINDDIIPGRKLLKSPEFKKFVFRELPADRYNDRTIVKSVFLAEFAQLLEAMCETGNEEVCLDIFKEISNSHVYNWYS
jgi:hypothetical protein